MKWLTIASSFRAATLWLLATFAIAFIATEAVAITQPEGRIQLQLRSPSGAAFPGDLDTGSLRIELVRLGDGLPEESSRLSLEGPGVRHEISLAQGSWRLRCLGGYFWCPETEIRVEGGEGLARPLVVLSRFYELRGRVAVDRDGSFPEKLRLQARVYSEIRSEDLLGVIESQVQVLDGGGFVFSVPSAVLDLRVAAEGYSPRYFWAVDGSDAQRSLGTVRLRRGGSISGFVESGETGRPQAGVEVYARIRIVDEADPSAVRVKGLSPQTSTNERGFFQFSGLPIGIYDLVFTAPGSAPQRVNDIGVRAEEEVHLGRDVIVSKLASSVLWIDPPVHPSGAAWVVDATATEWRGSAEAPPMKGSSSAEGAVHFNEVIPGKYQIRVGLKGGDILWQGEAVLADQEHVSIQIPLREVTGRITLDGEPVPGVVVLQSGNRDESRLDANAAGEFQGWLREPQFSVLFIEIQGLVPRFNRRLTLRESWEGTKKLQLNLDLVGRMVRGTVRDAEFRTVRGASVTAWLGEDLAAEVESDAEGQFELLALEAKPHTISARHPSFGESEQLQIDLGLVTHETYVELQLLDKTTFVGRVATSAGLPVQGALIQLSTVGPSPTEVTQPSGLNGEFSFRLLPSTEAAIVRVLAPGQGLWFGCRDLETSRELQVEIPEALGDLEIRVNVDSSLPPPTDGEILLFSKDRGFIGGSTWLRWHQMGGGEQGIETGAEISTTIIRGLAAGEYAVGWRSAESWALTEAVCLSGPPPGLDWVVVSTGATTQIGFDVRPYQRSLADQ